MFLLSQRHNLNTIYAYNNIIAIKQMVAMQFDFFITFAGWFPNSHPASLFYKPFSGLFFCRLWMEVRTSASSISRVSSSVYDFSIFYLHQNL